MNQFICFAFICICSFSSISEATFCVATAYSQYTNGKWIRNDYTCAGKGCDPNDKCSCTGKCGKKILTNFKLFMSLKNLFLLVQDLSIQILRSDSQGRIVIKPEHRLNGRVDGYSNGMAIALNSMEYAQNGEFTLEMQKDGNLVLYVIYIYIN